MIRVLIVDDEPLGRERLRTILSSQGEIEVVGEAGSGAEAVESIRRDPPDLVLLDIQMPGMSGFDVINEVGPDKMPAVIFVTAYDSYAIQAFDVNAADYVLKPVDPDRLLTAIDRATATLHKEDARLLGLRMSTLLASMEAREKYATRIAVPDKGGAVLLNVSEIDWIEAAGNYVRVHAGTRSFVLRESLAGFVNRLDPKEFVRVHRSAIVNVNSIERAEPWSRGEYNLTLRNGTQLTSSRAHGEGLRALFE